MPPAGTLVLSPHADDAALSLGATIVARSLPQPVTVATVFGRSSFTQDTGPRGDVEQVTRLRRAEDEAYCARRGLTLVWLDHDEALLRVGWRSIFRRSEPQPPARDQIAATLRSLDAQLILAPLGLGDHVDHVALAALARDAAGERSLAYYEDLPYATKLRPRAIAAAAARVDASLVPLALPATSQHFEAKLADVCAYSSQIAPWMVRALRRHARAGCERVWADRQAATLLNEVATNRRP